MINAAFRVQPVRLSADWEYLAQEAVYPDQWSTLAQRPTRDAAEAYIRGVVRKRREVSPTYYDRNGNPI